MDSLPPDLRDELAWLRARYVAGLGLRLQEVEEAFVRLESGEAAASESFRMVCHRLAGSAAIHGFDEVRAVAHSLFDAVDTHRGAGIDATTVRDGLRRLAEAVVRAGGDRRGNRIASPRPVDRRRSDAGDRRSVGG